MLTFPKSYTTTPTVWWMFPRSSNHRYEHIQCYVIEPNRILESLLTDSSATRQDSFILFTAYNIASQFLSAGKCQLTLGSFVPVSPIFSVSQPATVNSTEFQSTALDSFTAHIGFSECSGDGEDLEVTVAPSLLVGTVIATPTASNLSPLNAVTSGLNQNSTQSNV